MLFYPSFYHMAMRLTVKRRKPREASAACLASYRPRSRAARVDSREAEHALLPYASTTWTRPSLHPNEELYVRGYEVVTVERRKPRAFAQRALQEGPWQGAEPSLWLNGCFCS
jgi:hypothetical protein